MEEIEFNWEGLNWVESNWIRIILRAFLRGLTTEFERDETILGMRFTIRGYMILGG